MSLSMIFLIHLKIEQYLLRDCLKIANYNYYMLKSA
jgi:hypothetical protein